MKKKLIDKRIGCLIMASGESRRFGANKLLADFRGRPLAAYVIERMAAAELETVAVTRYSEIAELADAYGIRSVVHSSPYRSDMLKYGIRALGAGLDGIICCASDQPLLKPSTVDRLLEAAGKDPGSIWRIAWRDIPGNPVFFPAELIGELMKLEGDESGREVIAAHRELVKTVQAESEAELMDIDTEEDLEKLLEY